MVQARHQRNGEGLPGGVQARCKPIHILFMICNLGIVNSSMLESYQVFPALFDWVSYPITVLIKKFYDIQMKIVDMMRLPCFFHLELLASLERLLCFCHTGSTAVFATSLMHKLGLSLGAITDGFPMLHQIFEQPSILSAMNHNFCVDARLWPLHNGYPAIASKAAQIYSYSLSHFMVSAICFS